MQIGPYSLDNPLALAPMVGVTDRFFRQLCRDLGAGYVVTEMLAANPALRETRKSRLRGDFQGEISPVAVQIAGSDPDWMADAARYNVSRGAQIIDINMGCPAKKVCNKLAGSALLSDPDQVRRILDAVVAAVDVPVTLKIRTGPSPVNRNGIEIAQIAETAGIAALAVHGPVPIGSKVKPSMQRSRPSATRCKSRFLPTETSTLRKKHGKSCHEPGLMASWSGVPPRAIRGFFGKSGTFWIPVGYCHHPMLRKFWPSWSSTCCSCIALTVNVMASR